MGLSVSGKSVTVGESQRDAAEHILTVVKKHMPTEQRRLNDSAMKC